MNELIDLEWGEHRKGEIVLKLLLAKESKGIDLPMASTILRFRNPKVFQIIDRRAYRVIFEKDKYPIHPSTSLENKIDTYFKYLDQLIKFCNDKQVDYFSTDRMLYQFDIEENGEYKVDGKIKSSRNSINLP